MSNDPINIADPTGTTGVNMDAYRQSTQVWNEAKQQIQGSYGLSFSTPWNQIVPSTGIFGFNQKTYGDLVTAAYNDKVAWYDHGQGNVFFSGPSVTVVSDAKYAHLQEIADQPPTIGPEQLTPEQQQRQRTAQYWQGEVDAGRAMPEAAQAARLLVESDGNLFDALHGAVKAKAPDLLAGLAGLSETPAPTQPLDLTLGNPVFVSAPLEPNWVSEEGAFQSQPITQSIGRLRAAGLKDAHHVIQDAAVRELQGYNTNAAPGVQLAGPSTAIGSPHYNATMVQRAPGGGTYGAERLIGYNALRAAGYSDAEANQVILEADQYFNGIGVNVNTPTRIPGNRR